MKKLSLILFFILSLFFIVSFVAPSHTAAQPTNKFDCEWVPGSPGLCRVNLSTTACAPDFCNSPIECATTSQSDCERRAGINCIPCDNPPPPITPPPGSTCTGESTGLTGICKSTILGCGSGFMKDGSSGCNFGESCCVTEGVDCGLAGGECTSLANVLLCPTDSFDPTPLGGFGELGCSAVQVCCKPLVTGCSAWNPITKCSAGTRCADAQTTCCVNTNDCPVLDPGWHGTRGGVGGRDTLCSDGESIDTALGCIPVKSTQSFAEWVLRWAIGIAGGIAFILIIVSGFMISTSSGDPKRLQAGRELLTSAIAGLLLVIFAAFVLRLIGVDILGLFA